MLVVPRSWIAFCIDVQAAALSPLLTDRPYAGVTTAYVCEHFACRRPVTEPEELEALLQP